MPFAIKKQAYDIVRLIIFNGWRIDDWGLWHHIYRQINKKIDKNNSYMVLTL